MKFVGTEPLSRLEHAVFVEGHDDAPAHKDPVALEIRRSLASLGQDVERTGLVDTPDRVARMYRELLSGLDKDARTVINGAVFPSEYDGIVLVRDIEFNSLCEHHLLPFFGRAHVAYLPDKQVVGLSKVPRIVDIFAHQLQLQEQMTQQIAECLQDVLQPRGVAVAVEAVHTCMLIRGVEKTGTRTITRTLLGAFKDNRELKRDLEAQMGQLGSAALV